MTTRGIAQDAEQAGILIDLYQRIPPDVAGGNRQESARINFAGVRYEYEYAVITHSGCAPHGALALPGWYAFFSVATHQISAVMHCLSRLYIERSPLGDLVQLFKNLFVFLRYQVVDGPGVAGHY